MLRRCTPACGSLFVVAAVALAGCASSQKPGGAYRGDDAGLLG